MNYKRLSKATSYLLRHAPWEAEIELTEQGWAPISQLLEGLVNRGFDATVADLQHIIDNSDKVRFEIKGDQIKALHGHSTEVKIAQEKVDPPRILWHGTGSDVLGNIEKEGLKPMSRQYVHLSENEHMAKTVGNRKRGKTVLWKVFAEAAAKDGVVFYKSGEVYLADSVPPKYLELLCEFS